MSATQVYNRSTHRPKMKTKQKQLIIFNIIIILLLIYNICVA